MKNLDKFFNMVGSGTVLFFAGDVLRMILNYSSIPIITVWSIMGIIVGSIGYLIIKGEF